MQGILGFDKDTRRAFTAAMFGFLLDAYDLLIILSVLPLVQSIFFPKLTGILGLLAAYGYIVHIAIVQAPWLLIIWTPRR